MQGYLASVWGDRRRSSARRSAASSPSTCRWRWIFFVNLPLGALAAVDAGCAASTSGSSAAAAHASTTPAPALLTGGCCAADPRPARGRRGLAVASAAERRRPRRRRRAAGRVRRWSSGGPPNRCCRCGCSAAGCWSAATSSSLVRRRAADRADAPTCRRTCRACSAPVRWWPGSRWPRSPSAGRSRRRQSGRLYLRIGFRDTALIGATIVVIGAVLAALLTADSSSVAAGRGACFVIGVGLGPRRQPDGGRGRSRWSAGSAGAWSPAPTCSAGRSGSAVGAAVFGAIANATLAAPLRPPAGRVAGRLPDDVDAEQPDRSTRARPSRRRPSTSGAPCTTPRTTSSSGWSVLAVLGAGRAAADAAAHRAAHVRLSYRYGEPSLASMTAIPR